MIYRLHTAIAPRWHHTGSMMRSYVVIDMESSRVSDAFDICVKLTWRYDKYSYLPMMSSLEPTSLSQTEISRLEARSSYRCKSNCSIHFGFSVLGSTYKEKEMQDRTLKYCCINRPISLHSIMHYFRGCVAIHLLPSTLGRKHYCCKHLNTNIAANIAAAEVPSWNGVWYEIGNGQLNLSQDFFFFKFVLITLIVLYCIVLYCIVLYCIVLYCIVWMNQSSNHEAMYIA